MRTSSLKSLGPALAACLSLAACGGAPDMGANNAMAELPSTSEGPTPESIAAAKAAAEIAFCPLSKQHVTRAECKRVTEIWDHLETGKGAIEAPPEMVRDET